MTNASTTQTGIELTGKVGMLLMWFFFLFKPQIEVDGAAYSGKWNKPVLVPATPGQHQVSAYYKYYWILPVNRVDMAVTVPDGGLVRLEYKPSIWGMFGKGKLTVA